MESAINATHPDDTPGDDAESFFGDEGDGETAPVAEDLPAEAEEAAEAEEPAPEAPESRSGPTPEAAASMAQLRERREAAAAKAAEPEAGTQDAGESQDQPEPTTPLAGEDAESSTQGSANREYIVFQRLALNERVLKHLLKEIEDGKAPAPRVAFVELHRAVTRNDRQAIAEAYKANRDALGEKCDLAAVSSRSFKERHVEPRIVQPAQDISIT